MTAPIGAPGSEMSRREFVAVTGSAGLLATAGCASAPTSEQPAIGTDSPAATHDEFPTTSPPEVVDVTEQNNRVTIGAVPARHEVHPGQAMGGPVELPRVWAFQADGRDPSVPGPIIRTREGEDVEVVLDNTGSNHPHTLHFHGVRKTWENDGVPTTTGITVAPGEKHTYEIPAATRYDEDIVNVAPAERRTIEFEADADPGIYLMHCHKVSHAMNGNSYPGGMVTGIVYEETMDTDVFANLLEYAGYEG